MIRQDADAGGAGQEKAMKCPKCQAEMEAVTFDAIRIDRCTACRGMWFDEFELSDLKRAKGAEAVDTGDTRAGRQSNRQERVLCPKCGDPMIRMVDAVQPHIWYETCGVCGGSFLDAGEFRDLKRIDLVDKIKDFVAASRGGRGAPMKQKLSAASIQKILKG
jgi:uncharacterized protein